MEARPLSAAAAVLWSMAGLSVLGGLGELLEWVRPGAATDVVSVGAAESIAFLACSAAVLRVHEPGRPLRDALGIRPTHPVFFILGLLLGVILHGPTESLRAVIERVTPTPERELALRALLLEVRGTESLIELSLVVACVAPLVEELLVRGALFGGLVRRCSAAGSVAVSALCFAFLHLGDWRGALGVLLVGAVLGYLRAASGSLLPCIALHVAFNASTLLAFTTGLASTTRALSFSAFTGVIAWIGVGALLFWAQLIARSSPDAAAARAEDAR